MYFLFVYLYLYSISLPNTQILLQEQNGDKKMEKVMLHHLVNKIMGSLNLKNRNSTRLQTLSIKILFYKAKLFYKEENKTILLFGLLGNFRKLPDHKL